jgi:hypothetical protein
MASAKQVHVQMKDRLPCSRTDVEDSTVTMLDIVLAGDPSGHQMTTADDFGVGILSLFQTSKVPLGNDEDVRGCLRVDVFKRENVLVFVNLLRRNFAADDAAEKAIRVSHLSTCRKDTIEAANLSASH